MAMGDRFLVGLVGLGMLTGNAALAQWTMEDSHTTAELRGIDSLKHGVAWASGSAGTVLRTLDDGKTWQLCAVPKGAEKLDFRGVQGLDAETAIVMSSGPGEASRLYKTTDGCKSWKLVFTDPDKDGFWDGLQMRRQQSRRNGRRQGILIGDPVRGKFAIFETLDSGNTWRRWGSGGLRFTQHPARALKNESLFAASNESLDVQSVGEFMFVTGGSRGARLILSNFYRSDGPSLKTFSYYNLPFASHDASAGAFAVASDGWDGPPSVPKKIMIVGGNYATHDAPTGFSVCLKRRGLIAFKVFQSPGIPVIPPHGYRSSVAYVDGANAWITVGPNGTDLSTDDGENWTALRPGAGDAADADRQWNALSLPFVVGPKGRIGRLRDGAVAPK